MTGDEILDRIDRFECPRLTITGGEPLLQEETSPLVSVLIDRGYHVSVETNGSLDIEQLDRRCIKIVDVKCPSSGMHAHNRMENLRLLGPLDQIKFVIADRRDFDFSTAIAKRISSEVDAERIWFSPVNGSLPADRLASWILESYPYARLQLQLHKILWPNKDRGV